MQIIKIREYSDSDVETIALRDLSEDTEKTIRACARGSYQRDLLDGLESWSGSSLKGRAGQYGARYHASRTALLKRINARLPRGMYCEPTHVYSESRARWVVELLLYYGDGSASIVGQHFA